MKEKRSRRRRRRSRRRRRCGCEDIVNLDKMVIIKLPVVMIKLQLPVINIDRSGAREVRRG